jgi:hypothetical protein
MAHLRRIGAEPSLARWFSLERNLQGSGAFMNKNRSNKNQWRQTVRSPVAIALAIAIFGVLAMLIVDHGPWNRPKVQTADIHTYTTTGEAARAVGATVGPTEPKSPVEPLVPGPKPAQPANPATP